MTKQEVFEEAYTEAAKRRDEKEAYVNRLYDTGNEPDWGAEYQVYADTRRAIFNNPEEY